MPYRTTIDLVQVGEPAVAAINRVAIELQANIDYLKSIIDATTSDQALFSTPVALDPAVMVGQPIYYNAANSRFEQAQAIVGKQTCVGLCYSKQQPSLGTLILSGKIPLDLTNAGLSPIVTAGRYFLDPSIPGNLTATRPATTQISVLIADNAGNVFVTPQENVSIPGATGATGAAGSNGINGATGATGPQGPIGPSGFLFHQTGISPFECWYWAGTDKSPALSTGMMLVDTLTAIPFLSMHGGAIDKMSFNVLNVGSLGSTSRMAIYDSIGITNLYPNNLLFDSGDINTTLTGVMTAQPEITFAQNAVYWCVFNCKISSPVMTTIDFNSCISIFGTDPLMTTNRVGLSKGFVYAAMPTPFPAGAGFLTAPPIPGIALHYLS